MAEEKPVVGTTMTVGGVTSTVLWTDGKRLHVRSRWLTKRGKETSHTCMMSAQQWDERQRRRNSQLVGTDAK